MTSDTMTNGFTAVDAPAGRASEGINAARETLRAATTQVGDAVESVRTTIPDVARASRELAGEALQRIEAGSDQQITAGATMSLGLAIGMLLGGAPRFLIALALVPVAAIGMVMLGRRPGRSMGGTIAGR